MDNSQAQRVITIEGGSRPEPAKAGGPLLALLKLESDAREAGSLAELRFLIAGETRKLTQARQCLVFETSRRDELVIVTVSGLPVVERSAPMIMAIEDVVAEIGSSNDLTRQIEFNLSGYKGDFSDFTSTYPFPYLIWLPFLDRRSRMLGGMLLAREKPWAEANVVVAKRLSQAFSHAIRELKGQRLGVARILSGSRLGWAVLTGVAALLFVPVSVTTNAPFEITPQNAEVVAAPIEGTIENIPVAPNAPVTPGDILVSFSAEVLKSRLEVSERELLVAEARLRRASQLAFTDERGRHELGIASSELQLKTAERDLAREFLSRSNVRATRHGVAVYADRNELIGRPLAVGERIMRIADPASVEASLDVPVGDAQLLMPGARVKLFFDSDPLHPREAVIESAAYQARVRTGNQLAFRAVAKLGSGESTPRLGSRGTAQVFGETASLVFYLFRRPLAVLRQWIGL